jgi:hypothetical protein
LCTHFAHAGNTGGEAEGKKTDEKLNYQSPQWMEYARTVRGATSEETDFHGEKSSTKEARD